MNTSEPFAIVSPERDEFDSEDNAIRARQCREMLESLGIPHKGVIGYYADTFEVSFVIPDVASARLVGIMYNQDTVLVVDANGQAWLRNPRSGEYEFLGTFMEVSDPSIYEAYTYDPETGKYWTTPGAVKLEDV
jgi:hypothetical protein